MSGSETVELPGERATIRGLLYRHADPRPCVVMGHGFTATAQGMVADRYAEVLHQGGLTVLLIDHEGFGLSDGEPRGVVNRWLQCRGYQHAMTYAAGLDSVDASRLALWGDSLSGSVVLTVAALDPRVAAVVVQVPACGTAVGPEDADGTAYLALQEFWATADVVGDATLGPQMPVVSPDQATTPSLLEPPTADRWFHEYGDRPGSTWRNQARGATLETPVPYFTSTVVPHLTCPSLWIIAEDDEMPGAQPDVALRCFDLAGGAKDKLMVTGGHFGLLYDESPLFERVSRAQAAYLAEVFELPPPS
jgi:fermentation-respiration switch protein FrsA (DUF1100 family)